MPRSAYQIGIFFSLSSFLLFSNQLKKIWIFFNLVVSILHDRLFFNYRHLDNTTLCNAIKHKYFLAVSWLCLYFCVLLGWQVTLDYYTITITILANHMTTVLPVIGLNHTKLTTMKKPILRTFFLSATSPFSDPF